MALAYIDRVDTLSITEKLGVIRAMTRKVRVIFNEQEVLNHQDFSRLSEAFKAIDALGNPVPAPFSTLDNIGYDALVLVNRKADLVEQEPSVVDITLEYEHILDGPNQQFRINNLIFGKGRCSIAEKTTNFYRKEGNPNNPKIQIQVGHSFTPQDSGLAGQFAFPGLPYTILQGGEISIPYPQDNFTLQGVLVTQNPWSVARDFVACINEDVWLGRPPFTWICSEVQWQILSPENTVYQFGFEFQYNVDTWNPTVVFLDQRTGRPPAKVMQGNMEDPNQPGSGILSYNVNPYMGGQAGFAIQAATAAALAAGLGAPAVAAATAAAILPFLQPAGMWNVPALRPVNFDIMFGAFFEGFQIPGLG